MINKIFFQPGNAWAGDPIPFYNEQDKRYYLFYLYDKRETPATAYKTSWALAVSSDLVTWTDMGTVLPPGGYHDCDLCCYTGSVICDHKGTYHLFYTAQNPDNPSFCIDGKPIQYIVHAVSSDLINWEKQPHWTFTAPPDRYEPFDWRDPHVFYDPESREYCMLIAARYRHATFRRGGVTLICRSDDLLTWSAPEPFYSPGTFYTHECPDIFYQDGWWYLLFSTFTERFATHYRMSRTLHGPWLIPDQDTFDARALYAVKTAGTGSRRYCFGWIPTKERNCDFGPWQWGGTLAVHELVQEINGTLHVRFPGTCMDACSEELAYTPPCIIPEKTLTDERSIAFKANGTQYVFWDDLPSKGILTLKLTASSDILDFGLFLHVDDTLEDGYYLRFEPRHNRVVYDFWPRAPLASGQHQLNGDVPFQSGLERWIPGSDILHLHLTLVCCGTIAVIYINNRTAMSVRICKPDKRWGLFATRGSVRAEHICWHSFP